MFIKKGTLLRVTNKRTGTWIGIAQNDFDTEKELWYPIALHQDKPVAGITTDFITGDSMICGRKDSTLQILKKI